MAQGNGPLGTTKTQPRADASFVLEVGTSGGHTRELSFKSEQARMAAYEKLKARGSRGIDIEIEAIEGVSTFFCPAFIHVRA